MNDSYEPVIGLEVHVELNTRSKMFCQDSTHYFGETPNTHVCPVCLGLPGALPFINKSAIESCIKIGLGLKCQVNQKSYFERKNYFYPDLPKGYQISQYRLPLTSNGYIKVRGKNGARTIRVNRAHMEEDTGKLIHSGTETLVDFNRTGVPLVEIVTEPDFKDVEEIKDYAKKLQQMFRYLGVSEVDMEKGQMRLEANISVRKIGSKLLPPYRVELKNINSFRFMVIAVEYEIKRQIEALEKGEKLRQETRGWDEDKKQTFVQRSKEEAQDYRYFPEPDLPEMVFDDLAVQNISEQMPELPWDKSSRFVNTYGLSETQAAVLTQTKELADFYEDAIKDGQKFKVDPVQIANYLINRKVSIEETLPAKIVEEILGKTAGIVSDEKELEQLSQEAISENPKAAEDYKQSLLLSGDKSKKGNPNALQALIGAVMRKSKGKADISKIKPILENLLGK